MPEINETKVQFRIRLNEEILNEITLYCEWAGIKYRDYFIEQACKHVFLNDKEWRLYKRKILHI
jgi:hypothetical protein